MDIIDEYENHLKELINLLTATGNTAKKQFVAIMLQRVTKTVSESKINYPRVVRDFLEKWSKQLEAQYRGMPGQGSFPGEDEINRTIEIFEQKTDGEYLDVLEHIIDLLEHSQSNLNMVTEDVCHFIADSAFSIATASEDIESDLDENELILAEIQIQQKMMDYLKNDSESMEGELPIIGR